MEKYIYPNKPPMIIQQLDYLITREFKNIRPTIIPEYDADYNDGVCRDGSNICVELRRVISEVTVEDEGYVELTDIKLLEEYRTEIISRLSNTLNELLFEYDDKKYNIIVKDISADYDIGSSSYGGEAILHVALNITVKVQLHE